MQRKSFVELECPIARSLEQLGDGWTLLILRYALVGTRRFRDFEERLGIPPNTLARRLDKLVERGFLRRRRYAERPRRESYAPTQKALDLVPVLLMLAAWGNRWLAPRGAHIECAEPHSWKRLEPIVVDKRTSRELVAGRVGLRAGPRASAKLKEALHDGVVLGAKTEYVR